MSIGLLLGVCVGGGDGGNVGEEEDSYVGSSVGFDVTGLGVGFSEGDILGVSVGDMTGLFVGVPSTIGEIDGRFVGLVLGELVVGDSLVGKYVGLFDVGEFVVVVVTSSSIVSSILILGYDVGTTPTS